MIKIFFNIKEFFSLRKKYTELRITKVYPRSITVFFMDTPPLRVPGLWRVPASLIIRCAR